MPQARCWPSQGWREYRNPLSFRETGLSKTDIVREQRGFTVGADRTYMALPSCCRYGRQLPDPRHRCDVLQGKRREESERGKETRDFRPGSAGAMNACPPDTM